MNYTLPELRLILAALSAAPLRGKEGMQIALAAIAKTEAAIRGLENHLATEKANYEDGERIGEKTI